MNHFERGVGDIFLPKYYDINETGKGTISEEKLARDVRFSIHRKVNKNYVRIMPNSERAI